MPAPFTIVTVVDLDDTEIPVRLPGTYKDNRAADIEAAFDIALRELGAAGEFYDLEVKNIEYFD